MKAELVDVANWNPEFTDRLFYNINSPEDYEKIKSSIDGK
jgi:hypothetical protein